MRLKDLDNIWGIRIADADTMYKKYTVRFAILSVIMLITVFVIGYLYAMHNPYGNTPVLVIGALCIVIIYDNIHRLMLDDNDWALIKFYHKHKNAEVKRINIRVTEQNLFSIAFVSNPRLKIDDNQNEEYYKSFITVCCYKNSVYARHVIKYMLRYQVEEGQEGLGVFYITDKNKDYFIGYVDDSQD